MSAAFYPPFFHKRPIKVSTRNTDNTCARHSGRCGIDNLYLERDIRVRRHGNTIVVGESHLVVVQDSVKILNPYGIDKAVGYHSHVVCVASVIEFSSDGSEHTGSPFAAERIDFAVHFMLE
jgi:hypothetical protein